MPSQMIAGALVCAAAGLSVPRERYVLPAPVKPQREPQPQATSPLVLGAQPTGLPLPPVDPWLALLLLSARGSPPSPLTAPASCSPAILHQLLLSRYGRYLPYGLGSYGFYGGGTDVLQAGKVLGQYMYEDRL